MKLPADYVENFIADNGITQREFARVCGMTRDDICCILGAGRDIKENEAKKIGEVIGIDWTKLVGRKTEGAGSENKLSKSWGRIK
jgi:transcriptional regulator with XRE-family HTH domain